MGLGNGNPKSGGKGSNFNFEFRNLRLLGQISNALSAALPGVPETLATESTLVSVLNAIVASDQDIEILLVRDTGNGDQVVQQITNYETGTPVVTYKDVNGNVYVPVGPLEYLDPSAVLNLILTEVTAINNAIHLEVDDDAIAVEQELPTNINLLYGAFEGEGVEWERIQTDGNGYLKGIYDILLELGLIKTNTNDVATQTTLAALEAKLNSLGQKASAGSAPVVLSTEQEVILNAIKTAVESIDADLGTGGLNLEATQLLIKAVLDTIKTDTGAIVIDLAAIEVLLINIDDILATIETEIFDQGVSLDALVTDAAAIETELLDQGTTLDAIATDAAAIEAELLAQGLTLDSIKLDTANLAPAVRTYNTVSATGAGSVPAGSMRGSVLNAGNAAGTWNGISIPAGVSIPWGPVGNRDTYGTIAYDGTGTTLIIEYTS